MATQDWYRLQFHIGQCFESNSGTIILVAGYTAGGRLPWVYVVFDPWRPIPSHEGSLIGYVSSLLDVKKLI